MTPAAKADPPRPARGVGAEPMLELDHLVVACRTLAAGRDWCEATFGVAPEPGGKHALMGTHNLLLAVSSPRFPRAYLELIAIDPDAPVPARRRWFDLDDAALQATLDVPRLVHWVARTRALEPASARLREAGHDPGAIVAAERMTPLGMLRWRITLRDDGRRPAGGAVPLLIAWGDAHPSDALPERGVALESVQLGGVSATLAAWLGVDPAPAMNPRGSAPTVPAMSTASQHATARGAAAAPLTALLTGPGGPVEFVAPTTAAREVSA